MIYNELDLHGFNISVFNKKDKIYLYIYNNNYYCFIKTSKSIKLRLRTSTSVCFYCQNWTSTINIEKFIKQFALCDFSKIRFTGKGYKIKKNSKSSLILLFNRAHITVIWWRNIFLRKIKKYKMYINCTGANKNIVNTIIGTRLINIFTKKGLRKTRQILLKKKGKK
jgi:hypothetical protein